MKKIKFFISILLIFLLLIGIQSQTKILANNVQDYKTTANLHLREKPDAKSKSLAIMPPDTLLTITEISADDKWGYTCYKDIEGWARMSYLKKIDTDTKIESATDNISDIIDNSDNLTEIKFVNKFGIDVSKWNGKIQWEKVKESGVDFVIIRAGFSGKNDPTFETNYAGAKAVGLDVGVYFYTYATTVTAAENDAKEVLNWISGKQFEYPIYYDLEDSKQSTLSRDTNTLLCCTFLDKIKAAGYLGGLYSGSSWLKNNTKVDATQITSKGYPIWIARYYDSTYTDHFNYSKTYGMWQYSATGKVSGITGNVDMNICYEDYPTLIREKCYNGYKSNGDNPEKNDILSETDISTETETNINIPNIDTTDSETYNGPIVIKYGCVVSNDNPSMKDIVAIQRFLADMVEFTDMQKECADVDCDGYIKMSDVVLMQKYIAKLILSLPAIN